MNEIPVTKSLRMYPKTVQSVDRLKEAIRSPSFSDTVKSSIEVFDMIIGSVEEGGKVLIEDKNGKQKQLIFRGVFNR
jgi:hypothetical protein